MKKFRPCISCMIICFFIFLTPATVNSFQPVYFFAGLVFEYVSGKAFERVFDRIGFGNLIDRAISAITKEKKLYASLPASYPHRKDQIEMGDDLVKTLMEMKEYSQNRRKTDQQIIQKIRTLNNDKFSLIINRLDQLENKIDRLESRLETQSSRTDDLEDQISRQKAKLKRQQLRANEFEQEMRSVAQRAYEERERNTRAIAELYSDVNKNRDKIIFLEQGVDQNRESINRNYGEIHKLSQCVEQLIKTNFHFYYTGLRFENLFWEQCSIQPTESQKYDFYFEGVGTGLSLLIQKRIRLYGDLYFLLNQPRNFRKINEMELKDLNELVISGTGYSGIAMLTFFSKGGIGIEMGGGYAWSSYELQKLQAGAVQETFNYKKRGIVGATGLTYMRKHAALFSQFNAVLRKSGIDYTMLRIGLVLII